MKRLALAILATFAVFVAATLIATVFTLGLPAIARLSGVPLTLVLVALNFVLFCAIGATIYREMG